MLGQILGVVSGLFKPAANLIDNLTTTDEERLTLKNEMVKLQNAFSEKLVEAKSNIMIEELRQGDLYTKRARPTIIYGGLFVVLLKYILMPFVIKLANIDLPDIPIPDVFWIAWSGAVGVYSFGRTKEKLKK